MAGDEEREETVAEALTALREGEQTTLRVVEKLGKLGLPGLVVERRTVAREVVYEDTPPRNHTFHAVPGFLEYLERERKANPGARMSLFVEQRRGWVAVALDEDSGYSPEEASLVFLPHPRWEPWAELLGKTLPLPKMLDFLRENRRSISGGRDLVMSLSQVRASTEVTLEQGSGNGSLNGLLVKTTIKGQTKSDLVDLPETIHVMTPIFVAGDNEDVELELILEGTPDGKGVNARFASGDIREAKIRAFEHAAVDVFAWAKANDVCAVYGAPHWEEWRTVGS